MPVSPQSEIKEEVTSEGRGTGVEIESLSSPFGAQIAEPFDPDKIDVATRSMTVNLLLSRIASKGIDLEPEFQRRRGIWTEERQSRLIESLLLRIPLPTLYAAEDADESWIIVDGIQRLTAITRFVNPDAIGETRLTLCGLEYLGKNFTNYTYENLPPRLQRRLQETELVVHVIKRGTPEEVKFNIFARINTGGIPLSSQELRHALIPGRARQLLQEWAKLPAFARATANSIRDERMADRELVLRFLAFRLQHYSTYGNPDFDDFLRQSMRRINTLDDATLRDLQTEFVTALDAAYAIFGLDAFRKRYRSEDQRHPINKAVFETVAVNLASLSQEQRERLVANREMVLDGFVGLMGFRDFDLAVSQGTGDVRKVRFRFDAVNELFHQVLRNAE